MDDSYNTLQPPTILDLSMTHEEATAKLAEAAAAYAPAPPPIDPQNAGDARRRLDVLTKDREWGARFFAGHIAERKEFQALQEKIAAGDPAIGAPPAAGGEFDFSSEDQPSRQVLNGTVQMLRDAGVGDGAISQALTGKAESAEAIAAVKVFRNQKMSDPEWTKRFLAGGMQEKKEWMLWSIVIAGEPA
jgi:hypothetical protein